MKNSRDFFYPIIVLLVLNISACSSEKKGNDKNNINYLADYAPQLPDGDINVVIEVPAGTLEKWEVSKPSGALALEQIDGKSRIVNYLGYPGNYGMIPQTLLPKSAGGDGDPLDVIVLGPAVARGSIIKAKTIGVLRLLDNGEQDDKIIAVQSESPLYEVESIQQLRKEYQGITDIIETWFTNYKGAGKLESMGFSEAETANEILNAAISAYNALSN